MIEAKDLPPEVLGADGVESPSPVPAPATANAATAVAPRSDASFGGPGESPVAGSAGHDTPLAPESAWEAGLEADARALLDAGRNDVWDALTRRFESRLIQTALANTRGRRIEAANRLGIGRNTITRKIHELGLE